MLSAGGGVGKELQYGLEGEVVGCRAEGKDDDDKFAAVLFSGHDKPMYVLPTHLAAERPPMRLPGGFQAGEIVYYSSFSHEITSGPNSDKQLAFRQQGTVVGPRPPKVGETKADADCLMVRFQDHSHPQRVRSQRISRESPSSDLPGGLTVGATVYYAGGSHELTAGPDTGKELTYALEGTVLGKRCEGDGDDERYVAIRFTGMGGVMYMPSEQILREKPTSSAPAVTGPTPPPGVAAEPTTPTPVVAEGQTAPTPSPVDTEAANMEAVPVRPETPYVAGNDPGVPAVEVTPETPAIRPVEQAAVPANA